MAAKPSKKISFFTDYEDQSEEELIIPEDLESLSSEEVLELHDRAVAAFTEMYGDGSGFSPEDVESLRNLRDGIKALAARKAEIEAANAELAENAAELAAEVGLEAETEDPEEGEEVTEDEAETDDNEVEVESEEALAASARREIRVRVPQAQAKAPAPAKQTMRDIVMAAPDVPGFSNGQGMDFLDMGKAVDKRLQTFNLAQYEQANKQGRAMRQQFGIAVINKPFEDDLIVKSDDAQHVAEVMDRAVDETRLPGGSLLASGGWCAPSETTYDLFEMESRDGLYSLPEMNISRGGIKFTPGPDFATLFSQITGFHYTEAQDIAGTYAVDSQGVGTGSAGSKPCYKVTCPSFTELRLEPDGLCMTAGLLQSRGYPEVIARTIRGALVAHDHRVSGRVLNKVIAGSTAVTIPGLQAGATAPILTAISLQVEHYKSTHRLARATTLEAVFPYWVHGAIRGDLSRRLGLAEFDISDERIDGWFRLRGVNPQFVYNWQGVEASGASGFTSWPSTVQFLLYAAGTWIKGSSDIISLDTIYDSVNLGTNDYTALFTEEGWLVAKKGHDSRLVTVPICPDGSTHIGVDIACNGVG